MEQGRGAGVGKHGWGAATKLAPLKIGAGAEALAALLLTVFLTGIADAPLMHLGVRLMCVLGSAPLSP